MKILLLVVLCSTIHMIYGSTLYVLKKPTFLKFDFNGDKNIKLSEFPNLLAATAGLGKSNNQFQGLRSENPMRQPKVQIVLLSDYESTSFGDGFNVIKDSEDVDMTKLDKYFEDQTKLKVHYHNINSLVNADHSLQDVDTTCKANDALVYTIKIDNENVQIDTTVDKVLNLLYHKCDSTGDNYLVYVLAMPPDLSRVPRQAGTVKASNNITNKAIFYNENYPVTFNILFWTGLVLALAVFGGAMILCTMDPGTDTVIYRMTSQRIKKDQ